MVYIFGLKQATKMGLILLHLPLTITFITINKSSGTDLCWLVQTLFQQTNHDGMLNLYYIANKRLQLMFYVLHGLEKKVS